MLNVTYKDHPFSTTYKRVPDATAYTLSKTKPDFRCFDYHHTPTDIGVHTHIAMVTFDSTGKPIYEKWNG